MLCLGGVPHLMSRGRQWEEESERLLSRPADAFVSPLSFSRPSGEVFILERNILFALQGDFRVICRVQV